MKYTVYCCFSDTYKERNQYFFKSGSSYFLRENCFRFYDLNRFLEKIEGELEVQFPDFSILLFCPSVQEVMEPVAFWNKLSRLNKKIKNATLFIMPPLGFLDHLQHSAFLRSFWLCWDFVEKHSNFQILPNHDIFLDQENLYLEKMVLLFERVFTLVKFPVLPQIEHIRQEDQSLILTLNQDVLMTKQKVFGFKLAAQDGKFIRAEVRKKRITQVHLEQANTRILQISHPKITMPYYVVYGMEFFYQEALYNIHGIPLLPFTNYQGSQEIALTQAYELCNQWTLRCVKNLKSLTLHGLFIERPLFQLGARVEKESYCLPSGEMIGLFLKYNPLFKDGKSFQPLLTFQLQTEMPILDFPNQGQYFYIRFRSLGKGVKKLYFTVPMQYPEQKSKGQSLEVLPHEHIQELVFDITKAHKEAKAFSLWIEDWKEDRFSLSESLTTPEQLIILDMGVYPS